ncbi:DUF4164 domain-containing protein, partial [Pseudomonas aeruginosa]|uniref:DUF4164 domain-containing protein n=1 Tax=Pseudomonas aeruginosa TaxID=287 RepID=UPI00211768CD
MTESKICTCPSGNGSLRHPCPAHPASVEQAGGDERVIGWRERILAAHPNSDPGFWPDALLVEHMAAEIADLRAALAQPFPKCATCNDSGQIVVSGPHYQGEFQPPEYETEPCDMCAQPSPAQAEQAEAERPEVDPHIPAQTIAEAAIEQLIKSGAEHYEEFHFDVHIDGHEGERPVVVTVAFSDGPSAHELRMKAEQQRDSALAEVERLTRDRDDCLKARLHYATQLGEALARVAELENQDPVAHLRASDLERLNQPGIAGSAGSLWNGPREGFVPLYAAPVAQAQHSVP